MTTISHISNQNIEITQCTTVKNIQIFIIILVHSIYHSDTQYEQFINRVFAKAVIRQNQIQTIFSEVF